MVIAPLAQEMAKKQVIINENIPIPPYSWAKYVIPKKTTHIKISLGAPVPLPGAGIITYRGYVSNVIGFGFDGYH